MKKASLFSGIGGIDLAAQWTGMDTVVFCEKEEFPQRVLRKHWPDVPIINDVRNFTKRELEKRGIGAIDIISAGYPCQPFSVAGKRKGAEDDRHLWPEVARILDEIRPRWFVGENVAGHVSLGLDNVLADLESLGYTAQAFVIPACAVYASHRRDRVFVVAHSGAERLPEKGTEQQATRIARSGEVVADTYGIGNHSTGRNRNNTNGEKKNEKRRDPQFGPSDDCKTLAHSNNERRQERHSPAGGKGTGQHSGGNYAGRVHGSGRAIESGVGRGADELSAWMDGGMNPLDAIADFIASYPQPALIGQPQYDWEPPRVATGVKNRAARLKALGNAVDPLQIFPIMYAIKRIDDWLREGTA